MSSSSILHFWEAAAALAAIACWALYKFASSLRRDRLLEDTPLVKIRSAAQGYVKVYGRAKPAEARVQRAKEGHRKLTVPTRQPTLRLRPGEARLPAPFKIFPLKNQGKTCAR